LSHAPVN